MHKNLNSRKFISTCRFPNEATTYYGPLLMDFKRTLANYITSLSHVVELVELLSEKKAVVLFPFTKRAQNCFCIHKVINRLLVLQ